LAGVENSDWSIRKMTTFKEINTALSWKDEYCPIGEFITIKDTSVDGYFLLHHFLNSFLINKKRVVLTSLHNNYFHFENVQTRLSMSLQNDNLKFINGMTLYSKLLKPDYESGPQSWSSPYIKTIEKPKNIIELQLDPKNVLSSIYKQIMDSFGSDLPELIIVDHVNPLFLQHGFFEFLNALKSLTAKKITILIMVQQDESAWDMINYIHHVSDLVFTVNNLPTGYSKDVHGQLVITKENFESKLHFKTFDASVKLFAPGKQH
jgi:archaellum biogenesis ATPase FlaH